MIRFLVRVGLPIVGFMALMALLAVGLQLDPREVPSPLIGKPAPHLDLPRLDAPDERVATADLAGEVWLLNVWASWCVSCRAEHALLNRFAKDHAVPIVGLNYKDEPSAAQRWLAQYGNPYRFSLVDQSGRTGMDWGVYGVPETFVIDRSGVIRYKQIGPVTEAAMRETLLPLLAALQQEGAALRQEGAALRQEGAALQQEGAALQQEGAALQQEGAALQQEGAALQQEGAAWRR